jgi:tetratricopeptide (TPR) repeat protein
MLALFEGRFEDAEASIYEAFEQGRLAQSANAQQAFDLQMYELRREQGRLDDLLERVERAVAEYPAYPIWRYVIADVFAQLGRSDDARKAFDALSGEGFPIYGAGGEMQWLCSVSLLPEVCRDLGEVEQAATLCGLLAPYARHSAATPPELCLGSVSRSLGILAWTTSRWDEGVQHFEVALQMNAEMGARPWLAHTEYDFGRMLLERAAPGDSERAEELISSSQASSHELGMSALAKRISALSK